MSKPHTIHLPKDYKPYDYIQPPLNTLPFGIWFEIESFERRWEEAKKRGVAYKLLKALNIHDSAIRFARYRAKKNQLRFSDRKYFEKFVIAFDKFKRGANVLA